MTQQSTSWLVAKIFGERIWSVAAKESNQSTKKVHSQTRTQVMYTPKSQSFQSFLMESAENRLKCALCSKIRTSIDWQLQTKYSSFDSNQNFWNRLIVVKLNRLKTCYNTNRRKIKLKLLVEPRKIIKLASNFRFFQILGQLCNKTLKPIQ